MKRKNFLETVAGVSAIPLFGNLSSEENNSKNLLKGVERISSPWPVIWTLPELEKITSIAKRLDNVTEIGDIPVESIEVWEIIKEKGGEIKYRISFGLKYFNGCERKVNNLKKKFGNIYGFHPMSPGDVFTHCRTYSEAELEEFLQEYA